MLFTEKFLLKNEKTIFRYLSDLCDEGIEFERKIENRIAKYKWNKKISETTDFMNTLSTVFISRLVKTDSFVIYEDKDVETPFVYLMKLSEG